MRHHMWMTIYGWPLPTLLVLLPKIGAQQMIWRCGASNPLTYEAFVYSVNFRELDIVFDVFGPLAQ